MELSAFSFSAAVGMLCGILSGFGIGGGSILMVWLTAVAMLEQRQAQAINLIYFLPTAAAALIVHIREKRIYKKAVLPAAIGGCLAALLSSLFAHQLDTTILKKGFGIFLLIIGVIELKKCRPTQT